MANFQAPGMSSTDQHDQNNYISPLLVQQTHKIHSSSSWRPAYNTNRSRSQQYDRRPTRDRSESRRGGSNYPNHGDNRDSRREHSSYRNDFNANNKRMSSESDRLSQKKQWGYQSRSNYYSQPKTNTSVQSRMDNIRKNCTEIASPPVTTVAIPNASVPELDSSKIEVDDEDEAADYTVEVINNPPEFCTDTDDGSLRFKLRLDPVYQSAIKKIQNRRQDKQLVFPYPVTPVTTSIPMHDRFTMLS